MTSEECPKPTPKKVPVVVLVERDGKAHAFLIASVSKDNLHDKLVTTVALMADESAVYPEIGREYAGHGTVNHSKDKYVRVTLWYTNNSDSYFALLKRGVYSTFHSISEAHMHRYLAEFDFRHNTRAQSDVERGDALLMRAKGKRLMYHQPGEAPYA